MFRVLSFPFAWLDAFVQKRFDSACFFLMRRFGVRKSSIRYALNALVIMAYGGGLLSKASYGVLTPMGGFFGGLLLLMLLLAQHAQAVQDREAEARPGTASAADRRWGNGFWKVLVLVFGSIDALAFASSYVPSEFREAGLVAGQHRFSSLCDLVFWSAYLACLYLVKTPLNPPPEKVRETVGGVAPAPIES